MADEWGPWIEHDGKGCPVPGQFVRTEDRGGIVIDHVALGVMISRAGAARSWGRPCSRNLWLWGICEGASAREVVRYRIRRPKALRDLIDLVETLPAQQPDRLDA